MSYPGTPCRLLKQSRQMRPLSPHNFTESAPQSQKLETRFWSACHSSLASFASASRKTTGGRSRFRSEIFCLREGEEITDRAMGPNSNPIPAVYPPQKQARRLSTPTRTPPGWETLSRARGFLHGYGLLLPRCLYCAMFQSSTPPPCRTLFRQNHGS